MKRMLSLSTAILFGLLSAGAAAAQDMDEQLYDDYDDTTLPSFTIAAMGGGVSPVGDLGDGDFATSGSGGLAATIWLGDYVGLRATGLYAQTDAEPVIPAMLQGEDPNVYLYSGDVVLRYPIETMGDNWLQPYLVGGLGAKTYDFETLDNETDMAGNVGVGLEYLVGEDNTWGLNVEARNFISEFDQFGFEDTQHDITWMAGFSLNF